MSLLETFIILLGAGVAFTFVFGTIMWVALVLLGIAHEEPERVWKADDVQARIVTYGSNPELAHETARIAKKHFQDVHIVTDLPIDSIPGVTIDCVPEDFESVATKKGRALDWAQKHIICEKEYILYLDEDTEVTEFDGLPDADIVQFLERPTHTDSYFSTLIEVGRLGWCQEMSGFPVLKYPPYLWGGGFAVRSSVEDAVGWEFDSITEDTVFLWNAIDAGFSYEVTNQRFCNQAPPTVTELIKQRRRWFAGTIADMSQLPLLSRVFVLTRVLSAAMTTFTPVVILADVFVALSLWVYLIFGVGIFVWSLIGGIKYDRSISMFLSSFVLFPILHMINGVGAMYGIIRCPETFEITKKA